MKQKGGKKKKERRKKKEMDKEEGRGKLIKDQTPTKNNTNLLVGRGRCE